MKISGLAKKAILLLILFGGFLFYFVMLHNRLSLAPLPFIGPRLGVQMNPETGQPDTVYHRIPAFSLINQQGKKITSSDLHHHIYVADFFFATCRGICPVMTRQMKRVQDAFEEADDVKLISHTVDPAKDTVEALQAYAEMYDAIPGKWHFVTGNKDSLYTLAEKGYFLTAQEGIAGGEAFLHDQRFMLVDKEGHLRGFYDGTDSLEVTRLIDEIHILRKFYAGEADNP